MSCSGCSHNPLNGLPLGGNTEGGRLSVKSRACSVINNKPYIPYCKHPTSIQAPITPASGNRTVDLSLGCGVSKGVTADRVQELLARGSMKKNYSSETARILQLQQDILLANPPPATPIPIVIQACPPLPAPPGPPAPICILSKSQKY